MTVNSKHLTTGDARPPLEPGKLRIYSMRYCPYAHRALLVADAKEIPYDVVNCNLVNKPEFLLEINPLGKVPTIEQDGKVLYESLIVCDYMDEAYQAGNDKFKLNSSDPFQRAKDKILLERFNMIASLDYKVTMLPAEAKDEEVKTALKNLVDSLKILEDELKQRGSMYFAGNEKPGMVDYMIWPWFERFPSHGITWGSHFDLKAETKHLTSLNAWESTMLEDPVVKSTFLKPEVYHAYRLSKKRGNQDYDTILQLYGIV